MSIAFLTFVVGLKFYFFYEKINNSFRRLIIDIFVNAVHRLTAALLSRVNITKHIFNKFKQIGHFFQIHALNPFKVVY